MIPNLPRKEDLAREMYDFVKQTPATINLDCFKDYLFLYYYEAERFLNMLEVLFANGFQSDSAFNVLDVGYLHGLVPEFLHRSFPRASITVIDHPDSPVFSNSEYQGLIRRRNYLQLLPCNLDSVHTLDKRFDLAVLGEVIEHLDPTFAVGAIAKIRARLNDRGCLLITTPNGAGLRGCLAMMLGMDDPAAVVPDEMMMWPHIHVWSPRQLEKSLNHYGWRMTQIRFYAAFERYQLAEAKRHGITIVRRLYRLATYHTAQAVPRLRDMLVASFVPEHKPHRARSRRQTSAPPQPPRQSDE